MSELKAMGLVGVGTLLLFAVLAVGLVMMQAPGEMLAVALGFSSVIASLAISRVIKRYEDLDQRRKREATLLR